MYIGIESYGRLSARLIFAIMYLRFLLTLTVFFQPFGVHADDQIRVGAIFGLSGSVSRYGQWTKRGAEIARDEINGSGAINGIPLELIFEWASHLS